MKRRREHDQRHPAGGNDPKHAPPVGGTRWSARRIPDSRGEVGPINCSMLEAIAACERIAGRRVRWSLSEKNRLGDHKWWISDSPDLGPMAARPA